MYDSRRFRMLTFMWCVCVWHAQIIDRFPAARAPARHSQWFCRMEPGRKGISGLFQILMDQIAAFSLSCSCLQLLEFQGSSLNQSHRRCNLCHVFMFHAQERLLCEACSVSTLNKSMSIRTVLSSCSLGLFSSVCAWEAAESLPAGMPLRTWKAQHQKCRWNFKEKKVSMKHGP